MRRSPGFIQINLLEGRISKDSRDTEELDAWMVCGEQDREGILRVTQISASL